jgi:methionyl-tRNA formyltransferase
MGVSPRIVFFGTPEFAVTSLKSLHLSGYNVVAVVTATDKPAGRGLKDKASPVKEFALEHGIPVLQPPNMKDPMFLEQLRSFNPELQIVIAFRMMPRQVWELPPLGTFNLHASLLPQYRGAAPINWAVINGEEVTGVTTFFLNDQVDTGKIILSESVAIGPDESAGELYERLMKTGSAVVLRTVDMIMSGNVPQIPQDTLITDPRALKQAPKLFRESCLINWDQDIMQVHNFIRGLSPHPGATTEITLADGTRQLLKIYRAFPEPADDFTEPGRLISDGKSILKISAKNGFLNLDQLQLSGRKVMNSGDFLRGYGRFFSETRGI